MTALAAHELAAFAAAQRPEWHPDHIAGAIRAAQDAGWTAGRIAAEMVHAAFDEHATPLNITRAARKPTGKREGTRDVHQRAAEARAVLPPPGSVRTAQDPPEPQQGERKEIRW